MSIGVREMACRRNRDAGRFDRAAEKKRAAADRLLNYVSPRWEMINHPEFQRRGWQIGRGPTESRRKTSFRLKGRGRRWNRRNAEAVAALTTLADSHPWPLDWLTPTMSKT